MARWGVRIAAGAAVVAAGALAGAVLARVRPVGVAGPSMAPTLRHGDVVLAARGVPVRPGDVVIGRFLARPEMLVVKRAVRPVAGGWWLEGDNGYVTDDSRRYGPAVVIARVLFRYGSARHRNQP